MDQGLLDHLAQVEGDPKDHLRNKLARQLKLRFNGSLPMFFFVMEDRDKDDAMFVAPHAHGAIEACRAPLPRLSNGALPVALRRIEAKAGTAAAEAAWGKRLIREALRAACGPLTTTSTSEPISGEATVWLRDPHEPIFNSQYVDYLFKNAASFSPTLGDRRLALPYKLLGEAKRLWELIARGETAIGQWS